MRITVALLIMAAATQAVSGQVFKKEDDKKFDGPIKAFVPGPDYKPASVQSGSPTALESNVDEQMLRAAGLSTDGAALLDFFRARARSKSDRDSLLILAQRLGDPDDAVRAQTAANLLACGPSAIPVLRHVRNDLDNPVAAEHAQLCLEWLEGNRRSEVPIAACRVLAARKPAGTAEVLLAYLPYADDRAVVDNVKLALAAVAKESRKVDAALVSALSDPVPIRRAAAVEALCAGGQNEVVPEVRKLLGDAKPQVRMKAALALAQRLDAEAIGVLIDLLADLSRAERQPVEEVLQQLAGDWSPNPALPGDDEVSRKIRRDAWAAWWRNTDGPTLLAVFRQRTLGPAELTKILGLIDQLGDPVFSKRERAVSELVRLGTKVRPLLQEATKSGDLERARRAEVCLKEIAKSEDKNKLPTAAARLMAVRKPAGATEALLAYLPFTDDEGMKAEITKSLKVVAFSGGKPDPILLKTLEDVLPLRRAVAGEALAAGGGAEHFPAVRKLLKDPEPAVRLQVAMALVFARDKDAVPALIDVVTDLPRAQAWAGEDLLYRLAGTKAPQAPPGNDAASRKQFRESWQTWWKNEGANVDLAQLETAPAVLGFTVVAEYDNNGFGGRVLELDRAGKVRWEIGNIASPTDVQYLPNNHILFTESQNGRIAERDTKGTVVWTQNVPGSPMNVQRLPNGNTFVAINGGRLWEVERGGKVVYDKNIGGLQGAYKMPNGQMMCIINNNTCVRLDATGQEVKRFALAGLMQFWGGFDVTSRGHIVVASNDGVREYDPDGKIVWQAKLTGCASATRLPNGHTLVATFNSNTVVELDATGRTVWEWRTQPGFHPYRARQR